MFNIIVVKDYILKKRKEKKFLIFYNIFVKMVKIRKIIGNKYFFDKNFVNWFLFIVGKIGNWYSKYGNYCKVFLKVKSRFLIWCSYIKFVIFLKDLITYIIDVFLVMFICNLFLIVSK